MRGKDLRRWLPNPATRQNFIETFSLICKGKQDKGLEHEPSANEPSGPHVLEVAQSLQGMLDAGVVNSRAELARRLGVSRARVTQLLNLLKLPAEIRSEILGLPSEHRCRFTERCLPAILCLPSLSRQVEAFREAISRRP